MQTRRTFLRVSIAAAPVLLSACAAPQTPVAPTSPPAPAPQATVAPKPAAQATLAPKPATAGKDPYPTYVPFSGGPKSDYHDPQPIFADGFDTYPDSPFKANQQPPGASSTINVLIAAYFPVPTPYDQNPTWQAVNKQLNADVRMNIIPTADYRTKFATTMASDDLPDIMHIYFGYTVAPNLPRSSKPSAPT